MSKIKATKEEIQKAFDLWYGEYGESPKDFSSDDNAADTFIYYLEKVRENEYRKRVNIN